MCLWGCMNQKKLLVHATLQYLAWGCKILSSFACIHAWTIKRVRWPSCLEHVCEEILACGLSGDVRHLLQSLIQMVWEMAIDTVSDDELGGLVYDQLLVLAPNLRSIMTKPRQMQVLPFVPLTTFIGIFICNTCSVCLPPFCSMLEKFEGLVCFFCVSNSKLWRIPQNQSFTKIKDLIFDSYSEIY